MTQVKISGSCLCGLAKYIITGESKRFYQCQCKRCRKTTAAGFTCNLLITPVTSITWLNGESFMVRYKASKSSEYSNRFCLQCGSSMPQVLPKLDAVLVPSGSIDTEDSDTLDGHKFWESHTEWICFYDLLENAEAQ